MLHAAITIKGANAVLFNGEEVLGRKAASEHPLRSFELHWEAYALQRLFSKTGSAMKRNEVIVGASLNILACNGSGREGVRRRLRALLASLHLQRLDFLLLQIPRESKKWSLAAEANALVAECEASVGEGLTQFYGVGCSGFTMDPGGSGGQQQSLPSLLSALDSIRGHALKVRMEYVSRGNPVLGNTRSIPWDAEGLEEGGAGEEEEKEEEGCSSSSRGGTVVCDFDAASIGDSTLPTLSATSHTCVALGMTANLLTMGDLALPISSSILSAARTRGIATLALSPLDCLPSQEAVDARFVCVVALWPAPDERRC